MDALTQLIDKAFNYRGNVTVDLKDGSAVEGYIFNRDHQKNLIQVFIANNPAPKQLSYSEIATIRFTGADPAAGKSWEEWKAKHGKK